MLAKVEHQLRETETRNFLQALMQDTAPTLVMDLVELIHHHLETVKLGQVVYNMVALPVKT